MIDPAREHMVRASVRVAVLWAVHSITIALAGSAILGLRGTISPRITLAFGLAVAAMLAARCVAGVEGGAARPGTTSLGFGARIAYRALAGANEAGVPIG